MIARVETGQNWLENITLQMCNMVIRPLLRSFFFFFLRRKLIMERI
jgi:hypothetical protein